MNFKGSTQQKSEVKTHNVMGLFNCSPIAINPTLAEMQALGIKGRRTEPKYVYDDYTIIRIWQKFSHEDQDYFLPLNFYITAEQRMNQNADKYFWINEKIDFKWSDSIESINDYNNTLKTEQLWRSFYTEGKARPAFIGEGNLTHYLFQLSPFVMDESIDFIFETNDWQSLVNGDVSSLKEIVLGEWSENQVGILVGINKSTNNMEFYCPRKTHPFGNSPFVEKDAILPKDHTLVKMVFDLQDDGSVGERSWGNRCEISFKPEKVKIRMPDVSLYQDKGIEDDEEEPEFDSF